MAICENRSKQLSSNKEAIKIKKSPKVLEDFEM